MTHKQIPTLIMQAGTLDLQLAQYVNGQYFDAYSNGGYGHLPNPVFEDMITTDQYVARRMEFPSNRVKDYYDNHETSPFYQLDQNRKLTMTQQYDSLQQKGVKLVGEQNFGKYSVYASMPDPSGALSSYSSESEMGVIFWLVIGIGLITLVSNAVAPPALY